MGRYSRHPSNLEALENSLVPILDGLVYPGIASKLEACLRFMAQWCRFVRSIFSLSVFAALVFACAAPARAVTPESPEVKQTVEKALKWLETQDDDRLGARCLIGLSFYKAGRKLSDPRIAAALKACQTANVSDWDSVNNYSVGLALIFLLETDPEHNRSLAQRYVTEILRRQQRGGSWGYQTNPQGDTSQTQYPTLGLWLAMSNGLTVPIDAVERDCAWLLRTQDPSGAWGYQGQDPESFQRVAQMEIRPALVAAGLGSLYICADMLGVSRVQPSEQQTKLPTALKPIGDPLEVKQQISAVDASRVRRAMADGNRWFSQHYTLESEGFTHYYLYAWERYHSFRELAEGHADPNPRWYNDVVSMLRRTQDADGSWTGGDTATVATCFAVLTLVRSAKKTIATVAPNLGSGVLLGGMGLPKNTADLQERDGRVIESPLAGTIDELMAAVEKGDNRELERLIDSPTRWKLDSDVTRRSGEIAKLRSLVSAGSFDSRFLAVRALGRVRELDNVPVLIFALSDPDARVVREADKGLRFISRKFEGVGLPEEPKPLDVKNAVTAWKAWYQSIRPNAEFLD